MPVLRAEQAPTIEAHGLVARPLAVPSRGSRELAMWRLTLPPGHPAQPHTVDREEAFLVESGRPRATLGGREEWLTAGDVLLVPPGELFALDNPGPVPAHLLVCTSAGVLATLGGQVIAPAWAQ
jgi:quercetin dioxygenase-like cupin family protein